MIVVVQQFKKVPIHYLDMLMFPNIFQQILLAQLSFNHIKDILNCDEIVEVLTLED